MGYFHVQILKIKDIPLYEDIDNIQGGQVCLITYSKVSEI